MRCDKQVVWYNQFTPNSPQKKKKKTPNWWSPISYIINGISIYKDNESKLPNS